MKKKILLLIIAALILIPPVVVLALDTTIDNSLDQHDRSQNTNGGIYWVSNTTGYVFFFDEGIMYSKTSNAGTSWSSPVDFDTLKSDHSCVATWADWNTPGNKGSLIHVAYMSWASTDSTYYQYLDTADDSQSSRITVQAMTDVTVAPILEYEHLGITKAVGSMLGYAYRAYNPGGADDYGFEISIDGGNTWLTKASLWETDYDQILLFPGNETDTNDIWAVFWDISADELSLKTYDYSANSWSEDLISDNMTESSDYIQMSGDIRHSDGHLILSAWGDYDSENATLHAWDINGGSDITELTEVISPGDAEGCFRNATFIDQTTNTIYILYLKGTIESSVGVYYQYSNDGGVTWSGEITYSDQTGDYRYVHTSGIREDIGGYFMPVWFLEGGATSSLKTGLTNSLAISPNTLIAPLIAPDYIIDCPTCTDNLTSSGNFTSNETFSGGPPGFALIDEAAGQSGAPDIWLWGWLGMFAVMVPGFFITYMERKYGAGNGTLLLRMGIALIVIGLLVTWGRFDWWMIVFYLIIAAAPALMSRQFDFGGAGGIAQHGWIGFCATSWIGLTIINRILEGQFLTSSESSWWCSIQLFNEFRVFDIFTMPVLNFQFFTVGIPSLLRWDYSFFGGNAELIQYLLYTITAVVAFILFVITVGLLFNAFRSR